MKIKIVEISDDYIDYMKKYFFKTMMDNKTNFRKHTRKYIGVILNIHGFNYFAPLSSPKKVDYLKDGSIRKSSSVVLRMIENKSNGSKVLLGCIKLNNMIPVPNSQINEYDLNNEKDIKYKNLIMNEILWIEKNTNYILKSAKYLYNIKSHQARNINEQNRNFFESIVPFKDAEKRCLDYEP